MKIEFSEGPDENVCRIVEDNGIGREAAGRINNHDNHTQKGIAVAKERLKSRNKENRIQNRVWIDDLQDKSGNAEGTRVVLLLH